VRGPGSSDRIRGLDGLRACAILSVIAWHAASQDGLRHALPGALRATVSMGWAGVDLFFALSGYLITRLVLEEERARGGAFHLGHFYGRRALRILPPFYVVFAVNLALAWVSDLPSVAPMRALLASHPYAWVPYALFFGNYARFSLHGGRIGGSAFDVTWSLCVEEHFYLLWPAVLALVRGRGLRALVGLAVCLLLPLHRAVLDLTAMSAPLPLHMLSHHRLDAILWGALAALVPLGAAARRGLLLGGVGAVLALVLHRDLGAVSNSTWLGHSLGLAALSFTGALLCAEVAATPDSPVTRALDRPWPRALGRVSYGVYLVHFQCLDLVGAVTRRASSSPLYRFGLNLALGAALSGAVAWALHRALDPLARRVARSRGWSRVPARDDATRG
jgi:peptidoglycan/LPS O-acetylase OafA/YrhL